ncbi:MAG TPA: hypothetical protein VGD45_28060 [Steroidobacter sp.]|uniref:hypothetical protein n=1 Tax=Steroidobacter sp. TaxID=1978227 RepID=UPI002ED802C9
MSNRRVQPGDLYAIPHGKVFGLAKVIFKLKSYRGVMLIRLYHERGSDPQGLRIPDPTAPGALHYTWSSSSRDGDWIYLGKQAVTAEELAMTKRVWGDEVWIEDTHVGAATEQDKKTLQHFSIYGCELLSQELTRNAGN